MTVAYRVFAPAIFGAILGFSPAVAQTVSDPAPAAPPAAATLTPPPAAPAPVAAPAVAPVPSPAAAPAPPAVPAYTGIEFKAALIGTNEIPGPGDPDGTGSATVSIDTTQSRLCFTLMVANVESVTMAHIHKGPAGSMGNVVVPLTAPTNGSSQGCVQTRAEVLLDILNSPADFYVNVHSEPFMAGAVRGQLARSEPPKPAPTPAPRKKRRR